jgi:branched-subunit amino acid transport protein AzlD
MEGSMAGPVSARVDATKKFSASRVVTRTLSVWWRSLPQLLAIAAIVHVPLFAVKWWASGAPEGSFGTIVDGALSVVEFTVFSRGIEGLAVLLVFQRLQREPADVARSIRQGVRRLGTVLAIAVITAVVLFAIPAIAVGVTFARGPAPSGGFGVVGASEFAILSFVLVGLVYSLVFFIPVPAALVEGLGAFAAFNRSRILTSGCRGRILLMWIMYSLVTGIPTRLVAALVVSIQNPTIALLVDAAGQWLAASLTCVLPIVLYHDLRETKEGIGIEELLQVFD